MFIFAGDKFTKYIYLPQIIITAAGGKPSTFAFNTLLPGFPVDFITKFYHLPP